MFKPQPWGSWFEFALPEVLVAIDSRIELFPATVWDDYEGVVDGVDGWEAQLEAWDVAFAVSAANKPGLTDHLTGAGWRVCLQRCRRIVLAAPPRE